MKIRNGFVSNSSSSSFIIAVPKKVNSDGKLKKYLMGNQYEYPNPYIWNKDSTYSWPAKFIARLVFNDMNKDGPVNVDRMIEEYSSGYTNVYERAMSEAKVAFGLGKHEYPTGNRDAFYELEEKLTEKYAREVVERFILENPDCFFYIVSYEDDTELGRAMEHGVLFDFIPCLKVSHH